MKRAALAAIIVSSAMVTGCVSSVTHEQTVSELNRTRMALESLKKQAATDTDGLNQQLEATQQELADAKQALDTESSKGLESESAKGGVTAAQGQIMVTVLESVLFDSGHDQISPDGLAILKRVSEMLKDVKDGQIRIEGHTDNVPVGEGLSGKFPTNWELSAARAASVVRYLIEESGVDRSLLSAAGFADTKPVASNDSEEGRKANRRIEITMQPNLPIKVAGD